MELKITVQGPATGFAVEMHAIKNALESLGCSVTIDDDHPMDEKRLREVMAAGAPFIKYKVKILADHLPWGG